jgi:hypothetical protein
MFCIQKKLSFNLLESYQLIDNSRPILGRMRLNPHGIKRKINSMGQAGKQ